MVHGDRGGSTSIDGAGRAILGDRDELLADRQDVIGQPLPLGAEDQAGVGGQPDPFEWDRAGDIVDPDRSQVMGVQPVREVGCIAVVMNMEVAVGDHRTATIPAATPDDVHPGDIEGIGRTDDRANVEVMLPVLDGDVESMTGVVQIGHDRVEMPIAIAIHDIASVPGCEQLGIKARIIGPRFGVRPDTDLMLVGRHRDVIAVVDRIRHGGHSNLTSVPTADQPETDPVSDTETNGVSDTTESRVRQPSMMDGLPGWLVAVINLVRGGAIGASESLPGISGGTTALIVGLYDDLIAGAGHVIRGAKHFTVDLIRREGAGRAVEEWRQAKWSIIVPVLIGMAAALILSARLLAPLVERHPQYALAVFFGLVLASLPIPYRHSGQRWKVRHYTIALVAGAASFVFTGLPQAILPQNPVVVFLAAAIAVCALVLPGLSGSFILLMVGLYEPTLRAVAEADIGYLLIFALGMVVGMATVVQVMQFLLKHHHHLTTVVLTGLMAGSLRALWPWQGEDRGFVQPTDVGLTVLWAVIGFVAVTAFILLGRRAANRQLSQQ